MIACDTATPSEQAAWDAGYSNARQLEAVYLEAESAEAAWEAASAHRAFYKAVDRLVETPAPSLAAYEQKMGLVKQTYEDCTMPDSVLAILHGDIVRLIAADRSLTPTQAEQIEVSA